MHLQYLVNKNWAQSLALLATESNRAFTAKVAIQLNAVLTAGRTFHSLTQSQALRAL